MHNKRSYPTLPVSSLEYLHDFNPNMFILVPFLDSTGDLRAKAIRILRARLRAPKALLSPRAELALLFPILLLPDPLPPMLHGALALYNDPTVSVPLFLYSHPAEQLNWYRFRCLPDDLTSGYALNCEEYLDQTQVYPQPHEFFDQVHEGAVPSCSSVIQEQGYYWHDG